MITIDPEKEFQLNPLTAIVPFYGDFTTLSQNIPEIEARHEELTILLNDPESLISYNEQSVKRLQSESEMLQVILIWAGKNIS